MATLRRYASGISRLAGRCWGNVGTIKVVMMHCEGGTCGDLAPDGDGQASPTSAVTEDLRRRTERRRPLIGAGNEGVVLAGRLGHGLFAGCEVVETREACRCVRFGLVACQEQEGTPQRVRGRPPR